MQDWLTRLTPPRLLAGSLIALALLLSGCASHSSVVCEEPKALPATLAEPSLPDAQLYSEKVQSYFLRVESWLSEKQPAPTP